MVNESEISRAPKPEIIFEENLKKFNELVELGKQPDLRNANLSGLDLRSAKLTGLDLSGCYFRGANLSGLDLSGCNLQGASLRGARISGVLFPADVSAEEIRLSVDFGTRIRVKKE
jgi:uncharacterized protein YjbI with pentapeptide repeats